MIRILILVLCCAPHFLASQEAKISLADALIRVAKQENISLLYKKSDIADINVIPPKAELSINQNMRAILKGTNLVHEYRDQQIFLYRKRRIFGYIEDGKTGERLISSVLRLPSEGAYDITNEYGFFSIQTIADSVAIEVSYLGYATLNRMIYSDDMDKPMTIALLPDNSIEAVVITDALLTSQERKYVAIDKGSDVLLYQNQASTAIGGEPDIFQAIVRQSGVNAGTDGIGGIHIRGGRNDQNLVLYDGVALYNSAHALGLYSLVNNTVIDQALLHKSGASGQHSGRLSSILDIKTKDPDLSEVHANAQVSTIASQATVEMPIIKDRLGFTISGRRSHLDKYIQHQSRKKIEAFNEIGTLETGATDYHFADIHIKAVAKIDQRSRLFFTFFDGSDSYEDLYLYEGIDEDKTDQRTAYGWNNRLAALRLNYIMTNSTFLNLQLSTYRYDFDNIYEANYADPVIPEYLRDYVRFRQGTDNHELRADFETVYNTYSLKYGATFSAKNYQVGELTTADTIVDDTVPLPDDIPVNTITIGAYQGYSTTAYLTAKMTAHNTNLFESGIYLNVFQSIDDIFDEQTTHTNVFGYLKATHLLTDKLSLGGALTTAVQPEHLLTTGDSGYPSDLWVPSTSIVSPQRSYQGEIYGNYEDDHHIVNASLYYKQQKGIVFYDTIAALPSLTILYSDRWEGETIRGDVQGYGLELDYTYRWSTSNAVRAVYTYNHSISRFDLIDFGEGFPSDYSVPHTISLATNIRLLPKWNLMVDWYFSSGRPYTLYETIAEFSPLDWDADSPEILQVSDYNAFQLSASHKLSFALSTYWHWGSTRSDFSLGLQNAYNRRNVLYSYEIFEEGSQNQTGFPMIPMIRWKVSI